MPMKTNSETSEILSKEHEYILKVVDALELEITQLKNKNINATFFAKIIDFIRNYADKFHHEKEENKLIEGARNYIRLIREHIFKENNILYPMADEALSKKVQKTMLEKFNKINFAKKKEVERFEKFAKEMTKK